MRTSGMVVALLMYGCSLSAAAQAPVLRPQLQQSVQQANTLIANRSYADALHRLETAEGLGDLSPFEYYTIHHLRGLAAMGLDDKPAAIRAFDAVLRAGYTPQAEKQQTLETLVKLSRASADQAKVIEYAQLYADGGGTQPEILLALPQAYYETRQYARAAELAQSQIAHAQAAGAKPGEALLRLAAASALMQKDATAYTAALTQLLRDYPSAEYWQKLLAARLQPAAYWDPLALQIDRLRYATGAMQSPDDYLFAAQRALQAGFPAEAGQYLQAGYAARQLGQGDAAGRHERLKARVQAQLQADAAERERLEHEALAQRDGEALLRLGLRRVSLHDYESGLALMRQGLAKAALRDAQQAQLQLAYAQLQAGQNKEASATLRGIQGNAQLQTLAQLWLLRVELGG